MKLFQQIIVSLVTINLSGVIQAQSVKSQTQADVPFDSTTALTSRVQPTSAPVLDVS